MWSTLKTFLWQTRSALFIAPTVAATVVAANYLGFFNLLEREIQDQFFRMRPFEGTDTNIVVVTIDEKDIQAIKDWPIPDAVLAELLTKISAQSPRAVGLDMYRDLPEEPGYEQLVEVFQTTPTLIGIEQVIGNRVAPPPALAEINQVAIADLVTDADRKVRRALLTAQDSEADDAIKPGLATQVAMMFLAEEGISLEAVDADQQIFQLGLTTFRPLRKLEAGYKKRDLGGYQILMNWRGGEEAFITVPMRDILADEVENNLMRDRIVLIGSVATSTNDFFETPYSSLYLTPNNANRRVMPGVFIHANIASQLIQSALTGRTSLTSFSGIAQHSWIVLWALVGTGGSWSIAAAQQRRRQFKFVRGSFFAGFWVSSLLLIGAYLAFLQGRLVPVVAPFTALTISGLATTNAYRQKSLKDTNRALAETNNKLEGANAQLVDYSKTLEAKVEERTRSLAKAKQAADAANQAKSDFLANMSHELRTPLNGILGYAQILERSDILADSAADKERKGISTIHQCGTHLLTLINDILDLSKIEARKLELQSKEFDFLLFLEGVAEICRIKAEQKGIEFNCQFSNNLPAGICTDEKRLRQVLINLLGNAIKFTDHGRVTLSVSIANEAPKSSRTLPIRFQIKDTGVGMNDAQLQKIFLPFEQVGDTDKKAAGTGLGLAISQQIAEMMGSPLQVSSETGKGSTFWFTPAIARAEGWITSQRDRTTQITGIQSIRGQAIHHAPIVLTIDEDATSQRTITSLLTSVGFNVVGACNATEAMQALNKQPPNCVIIETALADTDGLLLIKQIKEQLTETKVIVASTHVYERDRTNSLAAGADHFLAKPLVIDQLLNALQQALNIEWTRSADHSLKQSQPTTAAAAQPRTASASTEPPASIQAPDKETLDALYHLSMMGDLNKLKGILNELEAENSDLHDFVTQLKTLSEQFQTKKIRAFIKSFL